MLEEGEPDGRHAAAQRHLFAVHQIAEHRRIVGLRKDQRRSGKRSREGQSPGGGVEHRHDRQDGVTRGQPHHPGRGAVHRVENGRAMLVENALGMAGRAAGVAEHARFALRSFAPGVVAVLGIEQRLERPVVEGDVMFDRSPHGLQSIDDRLKRLVIQQYAVFGVIGDVGKLIVEQPRIDRVDHAAHADRSVPGDQMVRMVHRQRCDAIARRDPQPFQRLRELSRVAGDAGPGRSPLAAIGPVRDDLAGSMLPRRVIEQPRHAQLEILHSAQHHRPSPPPGARGYPTSASLISEVLNATSAIPCIASSPAASSASSRKSRPSSTRASPPSGSGARNRNSPRPPRAPATS